MSPGVVQFAGRTAAVTAATFELFHLYSHRPGWVLDATLDGAIGRLWIAGTATDAWPRLLDVEYVDAPAVVTIDGRPGSLSVGAAGGLRATELGAGLTRITGALALRWSTSEAAGDYAIGVELIAALVT